MPSSKAVCPGRATKVFASELRPSLHIRIFAPTSQRLRATVLFLPAAKPKIFFAENGKCSCAISDASYKAVHRCRVCDSPDHAMLTCAKPKYPITASQSASSSTSSSTGADQSSWLRSLVVLSNEVRAFGSLAFQRWCLVSLFRTLSRSSNYWLSSLWLAY